MCDIYVIEYKNSHLSLLSYSSKVISLCTIYYLKPLEECYYIDKIIMSFDVVETHIQAGVLKPVNN